MGDVWHGVGRSVVWMDQWESGSVSCELFFAIVSGGLVYDMYSECSVIHTYIRRTRFQLNGFAKAKAVESVRSQFIAATSQDRHRT